MQTGLPPNTEFEVEAIDAATARPLAEVDAHSTKAGSLDVTLTANLRGVRRLHGEVKKAADDTEYGEADVDLNRHCHVVGKDPAGPPPAAIVDPGGSTEGGTPAWIWATAAAVTGLAAGAVWWSVRRRRSP